MLGAAVCNSPLHDPRHHILAVDGVHHQPAVLLAVGVLRDLDVVRALRRVRLARPCPVPEVQRMLVVVEAEQKRADHRAGALLVPAKAGDHAVGRALVLDLDHGAFPRAIGRIETLGHDAVEPGPFEATEPVLRHRAIARGRREVHRRRRARQHVVEPLAPPRERLGAQILVAQR